jgi:hypothetical protein
MSERRQLEVVTVEKAPVGEKRQSERWEGRGGAAVAPRMKRSHMSRSRGRVESGGVESGGVESGGVESGVESEV